MTNLRSLAPGLALLVAGCSGGSGDSGFLSLAVTDAPVDNATAVVVAFTGVEIKPAGDEAIAFEYDRPHAIDLLALSGSDSEVLLDGAEIPAGHYEWIRLRIRAAEDGAQDSYIDLKDGTRHELDVPSGAETGLQLQDGFDVPAGGAVSFTVDFDLRSSVHEPTAAADAYPLRPTLRIVDNTQVGAIAGTVAASLITTTCAPAVYVFAGSGVVPDDVDATAPNPVTTALVTLDAASGQYGYRAGFLGAGLYSVAFTCTASADDPGVDNALAFSGAQGATVVAGQTTAVSFAATP